MKRFNLVTALIISVLVTAINVGNYLACFPVMNQKSTGKDSASFRNQSFVEGVGDFFYCDFKILFNHYFTTIIMRNKTLISFFLLAFASGILVSCSNSTGENSTASTTVDSSTLIARGDYLVTISGCDDCHSPKRMGAQGPELIPELRLSGYPSTRPIQKADTNVLKLGWALMGSDLTSAVGPWGMSFAANITSDETGIGVWTEEQFFTALKKGKFKGRETGRDLLPPMPWVNYRNMKDEDVKAIFAFLKTTKPVNNLVPAPTPLATIQ